MNILCISSSSQDKLAVSYIMNTQESDELFLFDQTNVAHSTGNKTVENSFRNHKKGTKVVQKPISNWIHNNSYIGKY